MGTTQTVAKSIQLLMRDQGKTNVGLAQLLKISENHASRIVRGVVAPNMFALFTIADWLGVTADQLGRGFEVVPIQEAA